MPVKVWCRPSPSLSERLFAEFSHGCVFSIGRYCKRFVVQPVTKYNDIADFADIFRQTRFHLSYLFTFGVQGYNTQKWTRCLYILNAGSQERSIARVWGTERACTRTAGGQRGWLTGEWEMLCYSNGAKHNITDILFRADAKWTHIFPSLWNCCIVLCCCCLCVVSGMLFM